MDVVVDGGIRLHVQTVGRGRPVVVCGGGPSASFEYLVDDLAPLADEARLVFHDYRGSGRSSTAEPSSYTFERLGDDVVEVAQGLGHPAFDVVAHSMGVMVALSCALRHPTAVRRLVLVDGSPSGRASRMAGPTLRALGPLRAARVAGLALRYALVWRRRPESEARTLARFAPMAAMQEGAPEHRDAVRARERIVDNDNAPHLERRAAELDLVDDLGRVRAPALVVYGTRDAPFVAGARLLLGGLADAVALPVPGCGHHPLVEAHDVVLDEVRRFLRAGEPSGPSGPEVAGEGP